MAGTRDIKLARPWRGFKEGDVVVVSTEEYVAALDAQVVRKVYPDQVGAGVKRNRLTARKPAAKKAAKKTTAKKTAAKSTTPTPSGDEK